MKRLNNQQIERFNQIVPLNAKILDIVHQGYCDFLVKINNANRVDSFIITIVPAYVDFILNGIKLSREKAN